MQYFSLSLILIFFQSHSLQASQLAKTNTFSHLNEKQFKKAKDHHWVLLVFASAEPPNQRIYSNLLEALSEQILEIKKRQIQVYLVTKEDPVRKKYNINNTSTGVILLDKNQYIRLDARTSLQPEVIWQVYDSFEKPKN